MKKLVFFMMAILAIASVYAQGVNFCTRNDLKQKYYKVVIDSITTGTAPFEITFNGYQVPVDSMFAQYGVNNILTIRDANNSTKSDTIYEVNPNFHWDIGRFSYQHTDPIYGNSYKRIGISIGCSFPNRYDFDVDWYRVSDYNQIGSRMNYEPVPDSIWTYLMYRVDETPVGIYAIKIRDTVHNMDTVVFVEITDPGSTTDTTTTDTTTTDTTTTDTTTTDTTQHLNITITEKFDNVSFYPNPTDNVCNISEILREIYILDYMGRRLRKITHTNKIDLAGLPAGIYILEYVRQNGTKDKVKIVKRI